MHLLFILIAAMIGAASYSYSGLILGGIVGYMFAELITLKKRVEQLEGETEEIVLDDELMQHDSEVTSPSVESMPSEEKRFTGETFSESTTERKSHSEVKSTKSQPDPDQVDTISLSFFEETLGKVNKQLLQFFTGTNLMLKVGLIVLFFGVAFLLKYAAQQNLLPIEFRLMGGALLGIALLILGWRLRAAYLNYGLGLQGGGIGILYLVVFASSKIYSLLPLGLALGIMIGLVLLSTVLAVIQDGSGLAIFGAIGGFLAPVLLSSGEGSHVVLFSYYGLLNVTILTISWYKAWRLLNLVGFFFTFGIATLWGSRGYQPEHFSTTEPFLILYFLFYVIISILFAYKQAPRLKGFIDGPLVFGLPLVVSGLQYSLVKDFQYGMALSCCGLGFFYLLVATLLWKKIGKGMRLLCEAFLALGVVFASLAIPLGFDSNWSTATWALEGGAMVWIGVRQQRQLARIFGIVLQLAAAWMFLDSVFYPYTNYAFLNRHFLGCICIGAASLFSSYHLGLQQSVLKRWESSSVIPLLVWGMIWIYYGGLRETQHSYVHLNPDNVLLMFSCAITIVFTILARIVSWKNLAVAQLVYLPAMYVCLIWGINLTPTQPHLFTGWGWLAWLLALLSQYRLMHHLDPIWPKNWAGITHCATLWLVLVLGSYELSWLAQHQFLLEKAWGYLSWGLLPSAAIVLLLRGGHLLSWPVDKWRKYYLGLCIWGLVIWLSCWLVAGLLLDGNPAPLPYIPLVNPLEMAQLFGLVTLSFWVLCCDRERSFLPNQVTDQHVIWGVSLLVFFSLHGVIARSTHVYGNVPYFLPDMFDSVVFQAAVAGLWSFLALGATIWATKKSNRIVWCCGAFLLGMVVLKLFLIDLSGTGTIARIVSFLLVGCLMLVIGYFSPIPPRAREQ